MPLILEIKMYTDEGYTIVDKKFGYQDIDMFELQNDTLAYKIAEIAREELERIRKEKFLKENPELHIGGEVLSSEPF